MIEFKKQKTVYALKHLCEFIRNYITTTSNSEDNNADESDEDLTEIADNGYVP